MGTLPAINAALANNPITYSSLGTSTTLTVTVDDGSGRRHAAFRTFGLSSSGAIQTTDLTGAIRNARLIDITGTTALNNDVVQRWSDDEGRVGALLKLDHTGVFGGTSRITARWRSPAPSPALNNATLNIGPSGLLVVDGGERHTAILTLNGATINGGAIHDYNGSGGGNIDVLGASEIAGTSSVYATLSGNNLGIVTLDAPLTFDYVKLNGITIENGTMFAAGLGPLTILDMVEVAGATALLGATVTNSGTLQVDNAVTLTLNGTTIHGGALVLGTGGGSGPSITELSVAGRNAIGPEISADGNFVAFIASTGLPGGQDNHLGTASIELYNVATHALTDISAGAAALLPAGATNVSFDGLPSLSADGSLVVFQGHFQLSGNDQSDVFLYNTLTQQVSLVPNDFGSAVISGNGQFIAAEGNADQVFGSHVLVTNDTGTVLVEIAGDPTYAANPPINAPNINPASVFNPAISGNGQFISFWSTSAIIIVSEGGHNYTFHTGNAAQTNAEVYVYDTVNHTLQEPSAINAGTISDGGIFGGIQGNGNSGTLSTTDQNNNGWASSLSADGHLVVFQSTANNLVAGVGDANHDVSNIFLYDTLTGKIVALTDANGTVTGSSFRPQISADGAHVTFASNESDLTGANGAEQTYIVTINPTTGLASGSPQLLSTGFSGTNNGQNDLGNAVSNGGTVAAFGGAVLALNFTQVDRRLSPPVRSSSRAAVSPPTTPPAIRLRSLSMSDTARSRRAPARPDDRRRK